MINKFTDLNTWKESHKLVLFTYKTLDNFPQKEMFALSDQIRRCVVSISANIADVKYINVNTYNDLNKQLEIVGRLLTGLIRSVV